MRLSMWVLADWLPFENMHVDIQEGPRELRNVRLLPSSGELSRSTVYLDADDNGNVLCLCGYDLIVVPNADIDSVFNGILDCFEHFNELDARLRCKCRDGARRGGQSPGAFLRGGRYDVFHPRIRRRPGRARR